MFLVSQIFEPHKVGLNGNADPITYSWDPLTVDMQKRMSARNFMSMTLERSLKIPLDPDELELSFLESPHLDEKIDIGNVQYKQASEYIMGPHPEASAGRQFASVFDAGMPGALSLAELKESVNLGEWKLRVGSKILSLQVRPRFAVG